MLLVQAIGGRDIHALMMLDREAKLLTRDIVLVDMRLSDRVTVRLSEKAWQARQELRDLAKKAKKGGRV